jgi:hypothetical protein
MRCRDAEDFYSADRCRHVTPTKPLEIDCRAAAILYELFDSSSIKMTAINPAGAFSGEICNVPSRTACVAIITPSATIPIVLLSILVQLIAPIAALRVVRRHL